MNAMWRIFQSAFTATANAVSYWTFHEKKEASRDSGWRGITQAVLRTTSSENVEGLVAKVAKRNEILQGIVALLQRVPRTITVDVMHGQSFSSMTTSAGVTITIQRGLPVAPELVFVPCQHTASVRTVFALAARSIVGLPAKMADKCGFASGASSAMSARASKCCATYRTALLVLSVAFAFLAKSNLTRSASNLGRMMCLELGSAGAGSHLKEFSHWGAPFGSCSAYYSTPEVR